ncbi:MAG: succinyldiaminopimelate transaminase [Gammaproteobacteria bacterium]|nr:succinyldiaminopimelate transaminase [Gammaproteobacteria bacterium]
MNPDLSTLLPYPFERLNQLMGDASQPHGKTPIVMSMGEPKHKPPAFIATEIKAQLSSLSSYPTTRGTQALRQAIADWLTQRFHLQACPLDAERHILPVNGTREALFALAQCVIDRQPRPLVLMPNPFYQIYEGAALLAGAQPWFMNTTPQTGLLPNFDAVPASAWKQCQLIYICSPGNPTGAVLGTAALEQLILLADKYDFVIAADECYSEIYTHEDQPPPGLLETAARMGRDDYRHCIVFHSLSKRSSVAGMRSGFVAGDARIIEKFLLYRTYHGCAMPLYVQAASIKAWRDEKHVTENRKLYRKKIDAVIDVLAPVIDVPQPAGGFCLWLPTPIDDQAFTRELYAHHNVTVLPGSFLSRKAHGNNPGQNHVRIALVAEEQECIEAAHRLSDFIRSL